VIATPLPPSLSGRLRRPQSHAPSLRAQRSLRSTRRLLPILRAFVFLVTFECFVFFFRVFVVAFCDQCCVIDRDAGGFGRASAFAMSQLTWCTSRAIFSIFT